MSIRQKTTAGGDTLFDLSDQHTHGIIVPMGPPELEMVAHSFGDLEGVQHMVGMPGGQRVMCQVTYTGFNSNQHAMSWWNTLYRKAGQLLGEIIVQRGSVNWTSPPATFIGFVCQMPPFPDGSGVNGWVLNGMLQWILRGPYIPPTP